MKNPILISGISLATLTSLFFFVYPGKTIEKTAASVTELDQSNHYQLTGTQNDILSQDLKSLRQELATIKSELKHLTSRFAPSTNTAEWGEAHPSSDDEPEDPEVLAETSKQLLEQRRLALEDNYTNEAIDKNWSLKNIGTVLTALESLPPEIHESVVLNSTDCRSTTCRIEIEYDNEMAQQELEMRFPMLVGKNFPGISATHVKYNGVTTSVYFLNSDKS